MKKVFLVCLTFLVLSALGYFSLDSFNLNHNSSYQKLQKNEFQDGDIIFQSSRLGQSLAIQIATKSRYSHVGIIYLTDKEVYVYEAVQPVKLTPLKEWIQNGDGQHYVVKRLKNSVEKFTPEVIEKMKKVGEKFKNKDYDMYFNWSDEQIYCSELVWKIYKEALGIELGVPQKLKDFDLTHPLVQEKLKERYGNNIPYDEKVISPAAIFESEELELVVSK